MSMRLARAVCSCSGLLMLLSLSKALLADLRAMRLFHVMDVI